MALVKRTTPLVCTMKFQVESCNHSADIQRALFRRGVYWALPTAASQVQFTDKPFLYVDEDNLIRHGASKDVFDEDMAEEYVYRLGLVEPRQGRPLQVVPMPVFHEDAQKLVMGGDISDVNRVDSGALSVAIVADGEPKIIQQSPRSIPKPPIGLKPRALADKLYHMSRGLELAGAINHYTNAQLAVPVEWLTEYNERVEEIRKLEKIA